MGEEWDARCLLHTTQTLDPAVPLAAVLLQVLDFTGVVHLLGLLYLPDDLVAQLFEEVGVSIKGSAALLYKPLDPGCHPWGICRVGAHLFEWKIQMVSPRDSTQIYIPLVLYSNRREHLRPRVLCDPLTKFTYT